jgi:hydroxylamine reductase
MSMFCYQCEQTSHGTGCTEMGVCGKDPQTAAMQDLLIHGLKGLARYAHRLGQLGIRDREIDRFALEVLFLTVTNVNFDPEKHVPVAKRLAELRDRARSRYEAACKESGKPADQLNGATAFVPEDTLGGLIKQGEQFGIQPRIVSLGQDVSGLQELLLYGLKGMAAYADHAMILGKESDEVYAFIHEALDLLARDRVTADELVGACMKCGEVNLTVMGILDGAHTSAYGHPVPTPVRIHPKKGKAILVSGHDLKDFEALLKQTEGKGINIYTHSEMLPAHGYPELKKYPHLAGNYGGAWQDQRKEFEAFPGAILMTTNCIQKPKDNYKARIFTAGQVGWPGVEHVHNSDFSPVIDAALAAPGFDADGPDDTILVGFGHNAVMSVADRVIDAVKAGQIKHFYLIGGCDGAKPGRNYYTEFAESVPKDCVVLTLACGKYRFNKLDFGDIGGIPRLLDVGQCNDAYSAIQIAVALAGAFKTDVNGLPLSFILSWFEQKAVAILLTLLHLGVRDIRLGPTLPAFVSPAVLGILVDKFNIMPIKTAKEDLAATLA